MQQPIHAAAVAVAATTTIRDELATIFITATSTPTATARPTFIPLRDAAPVLVSLYTIPPAAVFLVLFTAVTIILALRVTQTDPRENGRRVLISGTIFAFVRIFTFALRIWLVNTFSLGLYITYVLNVLLPAFIYTGLTFHLLLRSLLPPLLPIFTEPTTKLIQFCIYGYAPFLIIGIAGLALSFTASTPQATKTANDLRLAASAALLILAIVLCGASGAAYRYLRTHLQTSGLSEHAAKNRLRSYLLILTCGVLFVVKFTYGLAALNYSPLATVNSEGAWYALSIVPELLSLLPFLFPQTTAILSVNRLSIGPISTTELVPSEAPRGWWKSSKVAADITIERSGTGRGGNERGETSPGFFDDEDGGRGNDV